MGRNYDIIKMEAHFIYREPTTAGLLAVLFSLEVKAQICDNRNTLFTFFTHSLKKYSILPYH